MRPLRHQRLWRAIGWTMLALVTLAMAIPTPQVDVPVDYADKWVHVVAFFILAAWTAQLHPPSPALWWRGLALVAYGIGTEAMQALLPWRSADWADVMANALGVGLGLAVAWSPLGRALQRLERSLPPLD